MFTDRERFALSWLVELARESSRSSDAREAVQIATDALLRECPKLLIEPVPYVPTGLHLVKR